MKNWLINKLGGYSYKEMLNERDKYLQLTKSHYKELQESINKTRHEEHKWIQTMLDSEGFYILFTDTVIVKKREHTRDPVTGRFVKKG